MNVAFWRAARRADRGALSVFECASPPKPYKNPSNGYQLEHPRMWEYDAQQMIRSLAKCVPAFAPLRVFVAEDPAGLAAVVSWREVAGPAEVHLDVIGVANRLRRQGGVFARELASEALREIEAAAIDAGADELYIEGEIFKDNDASQLLAADKMFAVVEEYATGARTWSIRVPLERTASSEHDDASE